MRKLQLFAPRQTLDLTHTRGLRWDTRASRWHVLSHAKPSFSRWIPFHDGGPMEVISDTACIAGLTVACEHCGADTEVTGIYCRDGQLEGLLFRMLAVTVLTSLDDGLSALLSRLCPELRPKKVTHLTGLFPAKPAALWLNHCAHCGQPQDPAFVADEWHAFYAWRRLLGPNDSRRITYTRVPGIVKLSGAVLVYVHI